MLIAKINEFKDSLCQHKVVPLIMYLFVGNAGML